MPAISIMEQLQLLSAFQVLQTPSLGTGVSTSRVLDIIERQLGVRPKNDGSMPKAGSTLAEYAAWAKEQG